MKEFVLRHRKLMIAALLGLGLLAFTFLTGPRYDEPEVVENEAPTEVVAKSAEVLTYGVWSPEQSRAVLAQIESDNEVSLTSELSGTLSQVNVNIGDTVFEGQTLARFKLTNDPIQINYLNSLNNLNATKLSGENSIKSAEIALRNAETELAQTIAAQGQNGNQSFVDLQSQAKVAETSFANALTFLDRQLGATPIYYRENVFGRIQIGGRNAILKNTTKTQVATLANEFKFLQRESVAQNEAAIKAYAQKRINFGNRIQTQLNNYYQLIQDSVISPTFTNENQANFFSQVDGLRNSIDSIVVGLTNKIQSSKGTQQGTRTAILSAQNRVNSAREQLELSKAQVDASVVGAQAQVTSAAAAQSDLVVRAPISGKIVEKNVNRGEQVNAGTALFTIVNDKATKKVVAFLSSEELKKVQAAENLNIEIDGKLIQTKKSFLSARIDPATQKIRAEFNLPDTVEALVGSFVRVQVPLKSANLNLLPISAIAFEPDGPEVLTLDNENIARRTKVTVGNIVADSVEVLGGIEKNTPVVRFKNRIFAGEKVASQN